MPPETAGLRMLHTGDAGPSSGASIQGYGLTGTPMDLAFIDRIFCTAPGLEIIEKHIDINSPSGTSPEKL